MDFGGLRDKAEGFAKEHAEQVKDGIDKAEDFAKDKIKGHDDQIEKAADKAEDFIDKQK